jgi:hypothetical protein
MLDIRNASIDAQTLSPAILVEDGTLTAVSVNVINAQSGIEVSPGSGGPSLINSVYLTGEHNPSNFGPRSIGVNVRSRREIGELNIVNSRICGYNEGVAVDGVRVSVQGSKICLADKGLVVYGGELKLDDSRVRARYVGVYADAGRAVVTSTSSRASTSPSIPARAATSTPAATACGRAATSARPSSATNTGAATAPTGTAAAATTASPA